MKSSDIEFVLKDFRDETPYKSILIDGPWGSGKTFYIKDFVKSNKRVYYVSLFGLESIDEINTALYNSVHKKTDLVKEGITIVSKVIQSFPEISSIGEALEYQLGITNNKKIKDYSIVIFDDLERLSTKIEYSDLLGYVNRLFLSNCRVVCVMSSHNLKDRLIDFSDFKEKVFDCSYEIDSINNDPVFEMFNDFDKELISRLSVLFKSNIRFATRSNLFYRNILKRIEAHKSCLTTEAKNQILRGCICAVFISFNSIPDFIPTNDFERIRYEGQCKLFSKEAVNGVYYLKRLDLWSDCFLTEDDDYTVFALLKAFKHLDYCDIDSMFNKPTNQDDNILNKRFYYLSDENKKYYYENLCNQILNNKVEWDDELVRNITSIYEFSSFVFDEEIITKLSSMLYFKKGDQARDFRYSFSTLDPSRCSNERLFELLDQIETKLNYKIESGFKQNFEKVFKSKDYLLMKKYLDEFKSKDENLKKYIIDYLLTNNFYLPDLSGDIEEYEWSYSHYISKFAKQNSLERFFIDYALVNCQKQTSNESMVDRFFSLIFYNIDNNFKKETLTNSSPLETQKED